MRKSWPKTMCITEIFASFRYFYSLFPCHLMPQTERDTFQVLPQNCTSFLHFRPFHSMAPFYNLYSLWMPTTMEEKRKKKDDEIHVKLYHHQIFKCDIFVWFLLLFHTCWFEFHLGKKIIEMLLYARQILLMIICGAGGSEWKFRMCETIEPLDGEKKNDEFWQQ